MQIQNHTTTSSNSPPTPEGASHGFGAGSEAFSSRVTTLANPHDSMWTLTTDLPEILTRKHNPHICAAAHYLS